MCRNPVNCLLRIVVLTLNNVVVGAVVVVVFAVDKLTRRWVVQHLSVFRARGNLESKVYIWDQICRPVSELNTYKFLYRDHKWPSPWTRCVIYSKHLGEISFVVAVVGVAAADAAAVVVADGAQLTVAGDLQVLAIAAAVVEDDDLVFGDSHCSVGNFAGALLPNSKHKSILD